MLDNLTNRLSRVIKTLRGEARLTEANVADALREVRMALLEADVALPVVKDFIAAVRQKALGEEVIGSLTPGQALVGVVQRELARLMGGENAALDLAVTPPAVILMAGLQGSGKTTTSGKLAKFLAEQKKKPLLASCDVYRPAAIEQLRTIAGQLNVDFFESAPGQQPLAIGLAALDYARKHYNDVLIVDTAGRLAIDAAMMQEISQLHAALGPVETLFVVDAMQGQDAVNVAKAFSEALPLTGVILTKLDGDARGGAALSVRQVTGKPLRPGGFQAADQPDPQDGRTVLDDRQAAGAAGAGRAGAVGRHGRKADAPHRGHYQFHDQAGARAPGPDEGDAQASRCGGGGGAGAGSQPPVESVRADAENDEADAEGRDGENDARDEGDDTGDALERRPCSFGACAERAMVGKRP